MANIIKNQILKHLSRFAKNLSHDQINLSTLKGEGELRNLELNEEILTDLLELPSWLKLTRADCNRVSVRIQWTKLKSVPIHLSLDEVRVEVETCENLRNVNIAQKKPAYSSGGHYGFADKVVDGITVTVNSVLLTLHSRAFTASFQMSRIVLESKSPSWGKTDLRMTRIKDTDKQEVLNFKELSWQTVRIEAKSTTNEDLTPLRLITNQARCRLTIKKRMTDCSVLGCRLVLILDDLLWVLTDDQLKAALHFADSLSGLLKRATEETQKIKGARKLESLAAFNTKSKDSSHKKKSQHACAAAKVFARYDVVETSYHFYSDRIDLHLCDDPDGKGRSCHPQLSEGGAFQISLSQLQLDFYPYHLAAGNRSAWIRYQESVHSTWLDNSITAFQTTLLDAMSNSSGGKNHMPLSRAQVGPSTETNIHGLSSSDQKQVDANTRDAVMAQFKKLLTANLVVRLTNFCMWKVSTSKEKSSPQEFVSAIDKPCLSSKPKKKASSERERFSLPDDMPVIHFEYTQFYYPGNLDFPLPPPKFFAYINPVQVSIDHLTVLWLNAFSLNLQQSVKMLSLEKGDPPYLDVKIEAIMLRIIVELSQNATTSKQKDRPKSLHVQASRILAANYRSLETGSKADLVRVLDRFQKSDLYFGTDFPNYPNDIPTVCDKLIKHATGADNLPSQLGAFSNVKSNKKEDMWKIMKKNLFWTEAKDVWYLHLDPVWADFHGTPASDSRPIPLLDALPISLWLYKEPEYDVARMKKDDEVKQAKMHILAYINSLVSIQLNHFQLLFLLRTVEMLGEITTFLNQDVRHILGEEDEGSVAVGVVIPQVDLSLLMPAIHQSRDAIGGDYDSFVPDSSSIYSAGDLPLDKLNVKASCESLVSSSTQHLKDDNDSCQDDTATVKSPSDASNDTESNSRASSSKDDSSHGNKPPIPTINLTDPSAANTPTNAKSFSTQSLVTSPKKTKLTSSMSTMKASLDHSLRGNQVIPPGGAGAAGVDEDEVSIRSDCSSDSENFVMISQNESEWAKESFDTALFALHQQQRRASPALEYAVEVTEDTLSDVSGRSSCHTPQPIVPEKPAKIIEPKVQRDGMISITTFHVGRFELAQQSVGSHACIKIQGASLSSEECPGISWEEFQRLKVKQKSKFTLRGKGWCESTLQPPASWCFRLRFSTRSPSCKDILKQYHESLASNEVAAFSLRERISRSADALVELRVQNLPLQFNLSTLNSLGDLFEDEVIPTPIPLKIRLSNIALHLIEDRPSPNITSPGSLPIDFAVPTLTINRDKSGLFSIQSVSDAEKDEKIDIGDTVTWSTSSDEKKPSSSMVQHLDLVRSGVASIETELQQRVSLLAAENSNLRGLLDSANSELQSLRMKVKENEVVSKKNSKLLQQQQALDKENKSLRQTLKYLQEELVKSGKKV